MDTWQEDQVKRMQLGGNAPFREFMRNYSPAEQGGYKDSLGPHDTYHCWAAAQYREKLDAALAGKDWSPSPPPANFMTPERPSSAQGLRKSRTSSRAMAGSSLRSDSSSPASFRNSSPRGTPDLSGDRKASNESYFASLGEINANRPDNLPPSQGGRYQGFGSTPPPSQHPSYGLSSASAPTLGDLQENPMGALSKGWSLFSSAVVGATKAVNDTVIQPSVEKFSDPTLQASVKGYLSEAQKRATDLGTAANQWSKNSLGVDVADSVGGVVGNVKDKITGGPARAGYGSLAAGYDHEGSGLYHDDEDWGSGHGQTYHTGSDLQPAQLTPVGATSTTTPAKKKNDWDDEWKDF